MSYTGTLFNLYIQGIWGWNSGAVKLCGQIYAGLVPCCTGRTQLDMWDQKYLLAATSLDGVRWAKSAVLHQTSRFADLYNVPHFRFEVLASLLLGTNTKRSADRAVSVLHGVLTVAVSDTELRAGCLLLLSSHGSQRAGGGSSMSGIHSRSLTRETAVLGWTDPAPNPIWTQKQQQSSAETSGGELERNGWGGWVYDQPHFPFYLCWLQHLILLFFISKNAPFSFTLTYFKLEDS